ncbi:MAG: type II secretion system F family protein [Gemmatimonadales bacterium]
MTSIHHALLELDLPRHKAEFYNAWHLGQRAGLTHEGILATMGDFARSHTVSRIRDAFLQSARSRMTIGETITAYPKLLQGFEAGVLKLGEETGQLETSFRFLADYFTAENRAVQTVKRWLAYPLTTGIAAIFIVSFPILFYGDAVKYVIVVTLELIAALAFAGGIVSAVARWYRQRTDLVLGRLCRSLALGVEAGLPLSQVAGLAVDAAEHPDLQRHVARILARQRSQQSLAATFKGCSLLPFELLTALEVADATGNYRDTLVKLAQMYDGGG